MQWFQGKKLRFLALFFGRFIVTLRIWEDDNPKSNFKQKNPKALRLKILMPLFSYKFKNI